MITKQKSLDSLLQETSTLQQDKDLHIIQKPKNLVLGLTMLQQVVRQRQLHHHHHHHNNNQVDKQHLVEVAENQNKSNLKIMKKSILCV